jgi:hypothetical protein
MYSAQYGGRSGRSKGKQATSKKKKHQKCTLCDEKGHEAEDCPHNQTTSNSGGAGSGRAHKTSKRAGSDAAALNGNNPNGNGEGGADTSGGLLPSGFFATVDDLMAAEVAATDNTSADDTVAEAITLSAPVLFDAGCDVGQALDCIATTNKKKSSTATSTYRYNVYSISAMPYAGCICRQLLKPGKPWKRDAQRTTWMKEADPNTFFVLGLGPGYCDKKLKKLEQDDSSSGSSEEEDDDDNDSLQDQDEEDSEQLQAAVSALVAAMDRDDSVVGVYAKLDYSIAVLERPGYDRETQLCRFRATCRAAKECNVPIQCRVAPGPLHSEHQVEEAGAEKTNDDDPYLSVVRDLATVLTDMSQEESKSSESSSHQSSTSSSSNLKVHLVC